MSLTVEKYMTPSPHSIGREQTLAEARHRMHEWGVRHLPVLHGGHLVGVLSDRDITLVETVPGVDAKEVKVDEAMTEVPYTVAADSALHEVARYMCDEKIGTAVVMSGEKLEGVFTTTDALRALADLAAG